MKHPFAAAFTIGAVLTLCSCQPQQPESSKSTPKDSAVAQTVLKPDNYERMKDCAAQADRMARESNWGNDKSILGWGNHYSPKYGRCYVQVSGMSQTGDLYDEELYDAFESKVLATYTIHGENKIFCKITDDDSSSGNCDDAKRFIDDHMKN